ncbi:hypothetical protein C943_00915 [Mariniradius saccharolyticus AK6]|uniref:Uncharacterized protein n=1 Tax=Mariniradius saccharolyticus AK6 TaxID=1239962 RepID=M7XEF8_9BACT|nr:hypothetical protein C943_00915 [Mariniradius saccharolyticus AK6]
MARRLSGISKGGTLSLSRMGDNAGLQGQDFKYTILRQSIAQNKI